MSDEQKIDEVAEPGRRAAVRNILLGTMIYASPVIASFSLGSLGGVAQAKALTTNLYAILDIGTVGSITHQVVSIDISDPNNISYVPFGTISGFADKYVVSATFDALSSKIFFSLSDSDSGTSVDNIHLYSVTFPDLLTITPFAISNTVNINLQPQVTYNSGLFYYAINNDPVGYDYSVNTIDNSGTISVTSINTSNLQNSSNGLAIFSNDIYATNRAGSSFLVYFAGISDNTSGSLSSPISPQPPGQISSTFDLNGVLWGTTQYAGSSPPSYSLYQLQCTTAGLPAANPFTSGLVGNLPTTFASNSIANITLFVPTIADVLSGTSVPFSANVGTAFNGTVANFTDTNTGSTVVDFTATIDWGDGTISAGTISGGSGVFQVSGTHTYAAPGTFSVSVTLAANAPGTATATVVSSATISDVLSGTSVAFSANAGTAFTGTVANFTDANTGNSVVDFTATINWGDGTAISAGSISGGGGTFQVSGTHTYALPGTFSVSVTLAENAPGTGTATVVSTATVNAGVLSGTAVAFSANAGTAFTGTVANFTDTDTVSTVADFTATINWGDGTAISAGSISGGGGTFQVSGTHSYALPGTFSVSVTLAENAPGTGTATVVSTATVNAGVLSGTAVAFSANAGTAFTGTVANFTDTDTVSTVADFTATINWGDGTAISAGTISGGSGVFQVSGTHTYAAPGAFSVSVTLAENAPGTATTTVVSAATVNGLPDLVVSKTHAGNFVQGQTGATYSLTVSNIGSAATSGTVTVTDLMPSGLTATAISGSGWICNLGTLICTRSDPLAAGAAYPAITLTVNVASNAPTSVTNSATVSGGGETNTGNDITSDVTAIAVPVVAAPAVPAPMLDRPGLLMLGGLLAAGVFERLRRRQIEEPDEHQ